MAVPKDERRVWRNRVETNRFLHALDPGIRHRILAFGVTQHGLQLGHLSRLPRYMRTSLLLYFPKKPTYIHAFALDRA
jgi:hypothetical protein